MKRFCRFVLVAILALPGCSEERPATPPATDSLTVVREDLEYRTARDEFFRTDPESPFAGLTFEGTRWYPVDIRYRRSSVLHRYFNPQIVDVFGTRGERRRELRYGYFEFNLPDSAGKEVVIRLNAYKTTPDDPLYARSQDVLSVWFTDETTGTETYDVGRYVDVGNEVQDPDHLYVIDLNRAFNPFCAYNDRYTCAVPREEDHIPVPLRVGEKPYHGER